MGGGEVAVWVHRGGLGIPFLPGRAVGIEDRPDRAAAVELGGVAIVGHGGGEEAIRPVDLVPEPLTLLVDEDHVLPIADCEAGRLGERKQLGLGLENERAVAPAAADVAGVGGGGRRAARWGRGVRWGVAAPAAAEGAPRPR